MTDHKLYEWQPGYPPGKVYAGMLDDFEVYMTIGGMVWHRRREPIPEPMTLPRDDRWSE